MRRGKFAGFISPILAAAICITVPLSAQASENDKLGSMEAVGTVGHYRIGLNYTVRQNTELVEAHYFYVSQSKNIPLTGAVSGESVHFHGADGSDFKLHFVGNGSNGRDPLTFYNSVGLRGTWSLGNHELPVELPFSHGTANPGQRLYSQVTAESDAAFESMVKATKDSILSGDPVVTSKYVHFPLLVNTSRHGLVLRTASALETNWSAIFTAGFLAKLRLDSTHEMFVHEGEAMLGDGELWFDDRGLIAVNPVVHHGPFR
jgi:hypothetical protein